MPEDVLNKLIIIAGQWRDNQSKDLENQFEQTLLNLQKITGKNKESAIQFLLEYLGD